MTMHCIKRACTVHTIPMGNSRADSTLIVEAVATTEYSRDRKTIKDKQKQKSSLG